MIIKRLSEVLITIFGVLTITFFMAKAAPGDPAELALGNGATPEAIKAFRQEKGLDRPIFIQYVYYLRDVVSFDLGKSLKSNSSVAKELFERLPATIELSLAAIGISSILGIILGVLSAVKRNTFIDYFTTTISLVGVSMPIFWLAIVLIIIFSIMLNLLPTGSRIDPLLFMEPITNFYLLDGFLYIFKEGDFEYFGSAVSHLVLPSITLATIPLSIIARITRASMLDVLSSDYIETATSYGIKKRRIIFRYALKNALLPIVTVVGLQFGTLLAGAILTETVFSWPGIGRWVYEAIVARDYPIIQAGVLVIAVVFVSINFLVDIIYIRINPKIRIDN